MSARFDFKPSIKNQAPDSLRITAPHETRDNLWNALYHSVDDIVNRTDNGKTQLLVSPYTGYSKRQVYVLTAVFLYSVVTELTLEAFWQLNPEEHLEALGKLIDLPEPVQFDPSAEAPDPGLIGVFEPISRDELVGALSIRIAYLAYQRVKRQYETFQNRGYNTDVEAKWVATGMAAYRRLQFLDPSQTFLSTEEWVQRVQEAARLIQTLEDSYTEVLTTDNMIDSLIKKGKEVYQLVDKQTDLTIEGEMTLAELWINFSAALEGLNAISSEIDRLCKTYDQEPAKQALKDIKALTPIEQVA